MSIQLQLEVAAVVKSVFQATESLAQALELGSCPEAVEDGTTGSSAKSTRCRDPKLESSMSSLASIASKLQEGEIHSVSFMSELSSTLACITDICSDFTQNLQRDREAVSMGLESAKAEVSQLEEALQKLQEERAGVEIRMQVELDRVSGLEREMEKLQAEKAEIAQHLSDMEVQVREANESVGALKEQLKEAEIVIAELRLQEDHEKHEDDLIEEELLELSSSHPHLLKTMRAADAEMNELHAKLAALEVELHGERRRHQDVVAKLEDLQQQIHRY
jgi:chromosome segregation ATPase